MLREVSVPISEMVTSLLVCLESALAGNRSQIVYVGLPNY